MSDSKTPYKSVFERLYHTPTESSRGRWLAGEPSISSAAKNQTSLSPGTASQKKFHADRLLKPTASSRSRIMTANSPTKPEPKPKQSPTSAMSTPGSSPDKSSSGSPGGTNPASTDRYRAVRKAATPKRSELGRRGKAASQNARKWVKKKTEATETAPSTKNSSSSSNNSQSQTKEEFKDDDQERGVFTDSSRAVHEQWEALLKLFEEGEPPTPVVAANLFARFDADATGSISIDTWKDQGLGTTPHLALRAYGVAHSNVVQDVGGFHFFLLFLVFFNNMFEEFVFFDEDDDLRVSKGEFMPVAESLGLFGNAEAQYNELERDGAGFVLYDAFCTACAREKMKQMSKRES